MSWFKTESQRCFDLGQKAAKEDAHTIFHEISRDNPGHVLVMDDLEAYRSGFDSVANNPDQPNHPDNPNNN